ncbi:hypothetical protein ScPMuIL_001386 [Solemya velum]
MGAMYMSTDLLTEPLLTAGYKDFWSLSDDQNNEDDQWYSKRTDTARSGYDERTDTARAGYAEKGKQRTRASTGSSGIDGSSEMVSKRAFAKIDTKADHVKCCRHGYIMGLKGACSAQRIHAANQPPDHRPTGRSPTHPTIADFELVYMIVLRGGSLLNPKGGKPTKQHIPIL